MQRKSFLILAISMLVLTFGVSAIARAQDAAPAGVEAPAGLNVPTGMLAPVGSAFTYQGQLKDASGPVTASCDFQFGLWDALTSGTQIGTTLGQPNVTVSEGLFTVQLDFGANAFNGSARWLEVAVRCPAGSGTYNTLTPRQPLTPAPYALYSLSSANADTLDGKHADAFQQHYQNLVVVAKSGGDFSTITDALNSITTNSADNPFTIYVAPGVYTETITMKPFVDIEGAGEQATKITYGDLISSTITILGANNSELRFLTVENTNGSGYAIAIRNDHASPHISHVAIEVTSPWTANSGVNNEYSSPVMTDVTIRVTNGTNNTGVYNYVWNSPLMTNITITVSGGTRDFGVYSFNSTPKMNNVAISASAGAEANYGVLSDGGSDLMMNNVIASASGGAKAFGVDNINASSPTMNNVIASASGATDNIGVNNEPYSSPMMRDITATASGGTNSTGVHNKTYAFPTMINIIATASDGTNNIGVHNEASSAPTMNNVTATATGGSYSYGVRNVDSSPTMTNVTATASAGGTQNAGVFNTSSSPVMTNVTATASGGSANYALDNYLSSPVVINVTAIASGGSSGNYGMWNDSSSPTIQNCVISASGGTNDGLHNIASSGTYTVKISNSQISASTSTIYQDSHYTTRVGASQIAGAGAFGTGTYVCVVSYDENYAALNSSCQ
jgi:hypothetical protein